MYQSEWESVQAHQSKLACYTPKHTPLEYKMISTIQAKKKRKTFYIPALRMELAMHSNSSDGRISLNICLNFSLIEDVAFPIEDSTFIVEGRLFWPRFGSLTVSKIMKPITTPGIPAMMNDLKVNQIL